MRELRFLKGYLFLGWAYAGVIIYLSLIRLPISNIEIPHWDKVMHFSAYFFLAAWFGFLIKKKSWWVYHAMGFALMGACLEVAQGLGGLRHAELADALANFSGVFAAGLLLPVSGGWLQTLEYKLKR